MNRQQLIKKTYNKLGVTNIPLPSSSQHQTAEEELNSALAYVLSAFNWNFARRQETLYGYGGEYTLPADCTSIIHTSAPRWSLMDNTIRTTPITGQLGQLHLTYTSHSFIRGNTLDSDIDAPPAFLSCVATYLAHLIAPVVTGSMRDGITLLELYKQELSTAKYNDAVQYASNAQSIDPLSSRNTHPYYK